MWFNFSLWCIIFKYFMSPKKHSQFLLHLSFDIEPCIISLSKKNPFPPNTSLSNTSACKLSCFSCVWHCDSMDCRPPGSSVHGILQARILECVAMPSSRGPSTQASNPHLLCFLHWRVGSSPLAPPGKPTEPCQFYQRFHKRNGKCDLPLITHGKLPCFCNEHIPKDFSHSPLAAWKMMIP